MQILCIDSFLYIYFSHFPTIKNFSQILAIKDGTMFLSVCYYQPKFNLSFDNRC